MEKKSSLPRYRKIGPAPVSAYDLTVKISDLNLRRIAREFSLEAEARRFGYALLAAVMDCPKIEAYFPEPNSAIAYSKLLTDTAAAQSRTRDRILGRMRFDHPPPASPEKGVTPTLATPSNVAAMRYVILRMGLPDIEHWSTSTYPNAYVFDAYPFHLYPLYWYLVNEFKYDDANRLLTWVDSKPDCAYLKEKSLAAIRSAAPLVTQVNAPISESREAPLSMRGALSQFRSTRSSVQTNPGTKPSFVPESCYRCHVSQASGPRLAFDDEISFKELLDFRVGDLAFSEVLVNRLALPAGSPGAMPVGTALSEDEKKSIWNFLRFAQKLKPDLRISPAARRRLVDKFGKFGD